MIVLLQSLLILQLTLCQEELASTKLMLERKDQDIEEKDQDAEKKDQDVEKKDQDVEKKDQDVEKKDQDAEKKDQDAEKKDQDVEKKDQDAEKKDQDVENTESPNLIDEVNLYKEKYETSLKTLEELTKEKDAISTEVFQFQNFSPKTVNSCSDIVHT